MNRPKLKRSEPWAESSSRPSARSTYDGSTRADMPGRTGREGDVRERHHQRFALHAGETQVDDPGDAMRAVAVDGKLFDVLQVVKETSLQVAGVGGVLVPSFRDQARR
ncbi:MAG: hypothetical protein OXG04_26335 [Acidobacteria bacterium]|nr:hypothetical protein [Acidobacteriota bacterium]